VKSWLNEEITPDHLQLSTGHDLRIGTTSPLRSQEKVLERARNPGCTKFLKERK
jgi:hypothetical protein